MNLDKETFDIWREGDELFKRQMLAHAEQQTFTNLQTEKRLTALEVKADGRDRRVAALSSAVGSVVGAAVGALSGIFK